MREVVGEMCTDTKRRLADFRSILLYLDGLISGKGIREDDLLGTAVYIQRFIFRHNLIQLVAVVTTVHAQSFEEVGEIFREVQREDIPAEGVVEVGTQGTAEGMAPRIHGYVIGHLWPVHAPDGTDKLVSHGPHRREVVFHGEVNIARPYKPTLPVLAALLAVFESLDDDVLGLERSTTARTKVAVDTSCREQLLTLGVGALIVVVIIKILILACDDIVEL